MIVLVLSTPRSGSHYYSESLRSLYPNSIVLHEVLSRAAQGIYLQQQGIVELSSTQYLVDSYYEDLVDSKLVRVFEQRPSNHVFFDRLLHAASDSNKTYIIHEHVSLMPTDQIKQLLDASVRSVYLTRGRREQIASRLIAGYTGVYMIKDNYMLCHGDDKHRQLYQLPKFTNSIATKELVENLLKIYNSADAVMQTLKVNTVAYEELPVAASNLKKMFVSSFDRLCRQDQDLINQLLG